MFRNFVYLNEDALRSYAEQLGIGNGKTTAKKFNLGAKAGPIEAGAEFEPSEQILSLASLYNKFEKALESQPDEYFDFLTGNPDSVDPASDVDSPFSRHGRGSRVIRCHRDDKAVCSNARWCRDA